MAMLIAFILAAAPLAGAKLQQEAEDRARADVADLLRVLCPEQCVLLSVRAQMDEEETGGPVTPGFDAPGVRTVPVVRAMQTSVLVDQRLPAQFRTRVKTLIAQRLKGAGFPAEIALEQVSFPMKNPPYLEAQPPAAKPPPPTVEPQVTLPKPEPVGPRLQEKLLEQAPLLAVMVLLGVVVLILGVLLYLATRRPQEIAYEEQAAPPVAQPQPAPIAHEALSASRLRKLEKQLVDDRGLRNAVVREALGRSEHVLVARWVRELGDFLLDDLRGDGTIAEPLAAVAAETVKPVDPAARLLALQDLEGRALAARLARGGEASAFSFLEGVREEAFIIVIAAVSPGAQEVALRMAPPHLRAAAMRALPMERRQEIALAWARKPEVSAQYALAAADELRDQLADLQVGSTDADRALSDVLDSLPQKEQDALLEQLRREGDPRIVSGLLTESALAHAPADLLGVVVLGLPPARLVDYLAGADDAARAHLLGACPLAMRREVEEELSLRPVSPPEVFIAARRELMAKVRSESTRRGLKPADVRAWRPRVVQAP